MSTGAKTGVPKSSVSYRGRDVDDRHVAQEIPVESLRPTMPAFTRQCNPLGTETTRLFDTTATAQNGGVENLTRLGRLGGIRPRLTD